MAEVATQVAWVAGATGYVGRAVVQSLAARGVVTWAHVRPDSPRLTEWSSRFDSLGTHVRVDTTPWEEEALAAALVRAQPTLVFLLLGTTKARARQARREGRLPAAESYQAVDYGLSHLLLQAVRRAGLAPRIVLLSALGVGPDSRLAYLQARWQLEEELRTSGLETRIARPAIITGADREEPRPLERLGAKLGDGLLALAGLLGLRLLQARYRATNASLLAEALVGWGLHAGEVPAVLQGDDLRRPGPGAELHEAHRQADAGSREPGR